MVVRELDKKVGEKDRGPITLYLNRKLYRAFQKSCADEGKSASDALENLVREHLMATMLKNMPD